MQPVERVLVGEGATCPLPVLAAPGGHLPHVAADRERLLAGRLDDDAIGLRLAGEARERLGKPRAHRRGQRIERPRAIERDHRARAACLDHHLLGGLLGGTIGRHLHSYCLRTALCSRSALLTRASSIGPIWTYTLRTIETKLAGLIR